MSSTLDVPTAPPPSLSRLATTTVVAAAVAAGLLVTVVLPAEYGIDPVGTGKALGLLDLYAGESAPIRAPVAATTLRPRTYQVDTSTLVLGPGQSLEYKYRLEKGAAMVYAWSATGAVKFEFHGEPDDHLLKVESYEKAEGDYASGALTAGFAGIHGWYWENASDRELTVTIRSAGFFTDADEMRPRFDPVKHKDRIEHIPHELSMPK